jgi:hypothetical protein
MTSTAPIIEESPSVPQGQRNELEINTALIRRFLQIGADEPIEITSFIFGQAWVAHATDARNHVRLLREAERIKGYCGSYMLVNGPMEPALLARYEPNKMQRAWNGRAADPHVALRRALFFDVDPIRPKGISSTDEQLRAAYAVSRALEDYLADSLGTDGPIGHGASGNGYFTLVALEPEPPTKETTARLVKFLNLLDRKFRTDVVKIDASVSNPARLMPAPGTWKRKGVSTRERPHRMTSFSFHGEPERVRLESIIG